MDRQKTRNLIQGDFYVTSDTELVLTTLLGSCVAVCLRDPLAQVGGMNHFLLPADMRPQSANTSDPRTVHLMELLVNGLMARGASRERLEAKLFGGARMMDNLSDIGGRNAAFAVQFLKDEGIRIVTQSLRGSLGRRIQFWPVTGRARQIFMQAHVPALDIPVQRHKEKATGDLELF